MNKKIKNIRLLIIISSFFISAFLCSIFWAICGIYPGSSKTLFNCDMLSQYVPFFNSLKSIINGENSLFYNWSLYLGGNYIGIYSYYLASPLSWLTVFFQTKDMTTAIYILCILKIALSGATFAIFLEYRPSGNNANDSVISQLSVIFFSICYSLMEYNMIYAICPMWIDSVIMLPIVILGLEFLISENKTILYYVSIALSFIFNFYTAYMIALFSILYFIYYYISSKPDFKIKDFLNSTGKYILNSILGVGTSLFLLLPTTYCLLQGKVNSDTQYFYTTFTHNLFQILFRLFNSSYDSITSEGLPNLFCGSICIILCIFYIIKKEKITDKITSAFILVFLILSLWITPLNRMWHMFKDPVWFPFRYSFVISFFVIVLAFSGFKNLYSIISVSKLKKYKKTVLVVITIFTLIELFLCSSNCRNGLVIETGCTVSDSWISYNDNINEYINEIEHIENDSISNSTYRVVSEKYYSFNDPMLCGYKGINSFASVFNNNLLSCMKTLGYRQDDYELYALGGTLISDSLLGIKYKMSGKKLENFYDYVTVNGYGNLYSNCYALPIGYSIRNDKTLIPEDGNVFEYQNNILNSFTGMDQSYFKTINFSTNIYSYDEVKDNIVDSKEKSFVTISSDTNNLQNRHIYFTVPQDGYVYLYAAFTYEGEADDDNAYNENKEYFLNGKFIERIIIGGYNNIINLGYFSEGDLCDLIITNCKSDDNMFIAELDEETTINALKTFQSSSVLENIKIKNSSLSGNIKMNDDGVLFLSIPYDNGWSLYIDGKKSKAIKVMDTFMGVNLSKGNHTVKLIYVSPLFIIGLIISICCILIKFIIVSITCKINKTIHNSKI